MLANCVVILIIIIIIYGVKSTVSLRIRSECGEIQTRKIPDMNTFHEVIIIIVTIIIIVITIIYLLFSNKNIKW